MRVFWSAITSGCLLLVALSVTAGHSQHAGLEQRDIKALSDEQTEDLLAGRGMGLALVAELNGYPGPLHVLELASELELSDEQLVGTQDLFDSMQAEAKAFGAEIVEAERELDRLFASGEITSPQLHARLESIGGLYAKLRGVHLEAHLQQSALLTQEQIALYLQLRGYDRGTPHHMQQHGDHRH